MQLARVPSQLEAVAAAATAAAVAAAMAEVAAAATVAHLLAGAGELSNLSSSCGSIIHVVDCMPLATLLRWCSCVMQACAIDGLGSGVCAVPAHMGIAGAGGLPATPAWTWMHANLQKHPTQSCPRRPRAAHRGHLRITTRLTYASHNTRRSGAR